MTFDEKVRGIFQQYLDMSVSLGRSFEDSAMTEEDLEKHFDSYLNQALTSLRRLIGGEIEGMKKDVPTFPWKDANEHMYNWRFSGYNQALSDLQEKLGGGK